MIKLNSTKWCGQVPYIEALALQELTSEQVRASHQGVILGLEHPAIITLGKRGNSTTDLRLATPFPIINIDRGGQATLHSPGQLVIYPILPLEAMRLKIRQYVALLEEATIATLQGVEISAFQTEQPGIYTSLGKIGFIGVRVERGVSRHGISINISNDLKLFSNIRSCGVSGAKIDRVRDHGVDIELEKFFRSWVFEFERLVDLTLASNLVDSARNY